MRNSCCDKCLRRLIVTGMHAPPPTNSALLDAFLAYLEHSGQKIRHVAQAADVPETHLYNFKATGAIKESAEKLRNWLIQWGNIPETDALRGPTDTYVVREAAPAFPGKEDLSAPRKLSHILGAQFLAFGQELLSEDVTEEQKAIKYLSFIETHHRIRKAYVQQLREANPARAKKAKDH